MYYSTKTGHGYEYSLVECSGPLESAGSGRHVLLDGRDAGLADGLHVFVVQLLGGTQLVVHHLNDLGVVLVEVLPYQWPLQQRTENVNQLSTNDHTN